MLDILAKILCVIQSLASIIEYAIVATLNLLIIALSGALTLLLPLLPSMPAFPDVTTLGSFSWFAYFVPISSFAALGATALTIFVAVFAVRIPLRWIKAL